jgi:hypothetical protein
MRGRTVSFYIDSELMPTVLQVVDNELLPIYSSMPHFLGLVILESEVAGGRPEVVGLSVWDEEMDDSETVINGFLQRLYETTGVSASQRTYRVLRLVTENGGV